MQHERVSAQQAGREIGFRDTIFEREREEEEEEEGNQRKFETLRKKSTSKLAEENGLLLFCSVSAVLIFNFEAAHNQPVFFSPNGGGETPKIIWVRERDAFEKQRPLFSSLSLFHSSSYCSIPLGCQLTHSYTYIQQLFSTAAACCSPSSSSFPS